MSNPSLPPKAVVSKLPKLLSHLAACSIVDKAVQEHAQALKTLRKHDANKENQQVRSTEFYISVITCDAESGLQSPSPLHGIKRSFSETDMSSMPPGLSALDLPGNKYARRDDSTDVSYLVHPDPSIAEVDTWAYSLRNEFQTDVLKLCIASNIAFRAVEVPYFQHFFKKWIPGAPLPTRQALSDRLLKKESRRVIDGMKLHLKGRYGTGQTDGWKSITRSNIIASMVNAEYEVRALLRASVVANIILNPPSTQSYVLDSHDVTHQAKTAENLLPIVEAEIDFCEKELQMIIAAWCTDGGGDCAKMRKLLRLKRPHLATPHCWAHQVAGLSVMCHWRYVLTTCLHRFDCLSETT